MAGGQAKGYGRGCARNSGAGATRPPGGVTAAPNRATKIAGVGTHDAKGVEEAAGCVGVGGDARFVVGAEREWGGSTRGAPQRPHASGYPHTRHARKDGANGEQVRVEAHLGSGWLALRVVEMWWPKNDGV